MVSNSTGNPQCANVIEPEPPKSPGSKKKGRILRLAIGVPLILLVWYYVGNALWGSFQKIDWTRLDISWTFLLASMATLLCARFTNAATCKQVLAAMGHTLPTSRVLPVIWTASLGRYIPGKMAVMAGAMLGLMRLGVRMPVAVAALFLSTALMILVSLLTAAPLMLMPAMRQAIPGGGIASVVLLSVGLVGLHPRVFTGICNLVLRRVKREPLPEALLIAPFALAIGMTLLRMTFLGLGLWCAARSLGTISVASYPLALGAAGAASAAGFLAVFAPAGLGVHEAVYLLTIGPLLGPQAGLLVVLFRFFNLSADAIAGGTGMFLIKFTAQAKQAS